MKLRVPDPEPFKRKLEKGGGLPPTVRMVEGKGYVEFFWERGVTPKESLAHVVGKAIGLMV